ncbi:HU family DNA-binding protein [Methylosinus sp. PW1]|uniref:HU family DNA-binding protein n=1 Tax=Methylosinus sp. PW1 TaxID=107636 RepID=UPI0035238527
MIRFPDADDAACFRGNGEQPDGVLDAAVSRSTVTRDDLAHAIYARIPGLSRTDAKALLDCALEEMLSALARGEDLSLRRFGTFRIRSKNARPARAALNLLTPIVFIRAESADASLSSAEAQSCPRN